MQTDQVKVDGTPERWLVAARLSRQGKRERERGNVIDGIQTQDQRAAEWAASEGHVIAHVTRDRNVSGTVPPWERPELGPWLTDPALIVQYDGIVAYDVSRLSRDYADLSWLRKWAEKHGKKLYVIKDRLRWPDNRDGVLWGVAAERAYAERLELIERTTRELDALKAGGKLIGRPPFGYAVEGDKYDRHLVPTDEGRAYIPQVFARIIAGDSTETIAAWLRDSGVKPLSGTWWARTVGTIIRNPVYMGRRCELEIIPPDEVQTRDGKPVKYRYGSRWVESPRKQYGRTIHRCEALVDAATWRDANKALSSHPKRGHLDPEHHAMLAGALGCPFCADSPMHKHGSYNGQRKLHVYYICKGRGSQRRGCGNAVRMSKVDDAVNDIMADHWHVPVMRQEIKRGNEAELEAALADIAFELRQLPARGLSRADEDAERARLRDAEDAVRATPLIDDTVQWVRTDESYAALWGALSDAERGPWLVAQGFTVEASRKSVTVRQGERSATVPLAPPWSR